MKYLITVILCGMSAYGGSYAAMKRFDYTHAVIIIPKQDGFFVANDTDSERAKTAWSKKQVVTK